MNEIEKLRSRLDKNEKSITHAKQKAAEILAAYTDASGKVRSDQAQQWSALQAELELLQGEQSELQKRYNVAYLAPLESIVSEGEAELKRLASESKDARLKMQALSAERLHFMNRGGRTGETEESAKKIIEIETKLLTAKIESRLAAKRTEKARFELDRAREDLRSAQADLVG